MAEADPVNRFPVGTGEVLAVNLARVIPTPVARVHGPRDDKPSHTGIDKRPAAGPVSVGVLGLTGDSICDTKNHGGPDQAVYAYADEDTDWWRRELGHEVAIELGCGSLGENLTLRGVDVTNAVVGECWRIGSTVLQVSVPRLPCTTFASYWGVPKLVKRFTVAARPGAYLRVLTEGQLSAGDEVTVFDRPAHGVTIGETFRALTLERELLPRLLGAPELPDEVHERARAWVARQVPADSLSPR